MIMSQVPVTESRDQRVAPEGRPALGEWALKLLNQKWGILERGVF